MQCIRTFSIGDHLIIGTSTILVQNLVTAIILPPGSDTVSVPHHLIFTWQEADGGRQD